MPLYRLQELYTGHCTACRNCTQAIVPPVGTVHRPLYRLQELYTGHCTTCRNCTQAIVPPSGTVHGPLYPLQELYTGHCTACRNCSNRAVPPAVYPGLFTACRNCTPGLPLNFSLYELKTLEWDILNPDRLINLEIDNKRRTSII